MRIEDWPYEIDIKKVNLNEKWLYETISVICQSEYLNDYIQYLSQVFQNKENSIEKRGIASRLLGALGKNEKQLIEVLINEENNILNLSIKEALVEIGGNAGKEIFIRLLQESQKTPIVLIQALREIMNSLCTSTEFRLLCYCLARQLAIIDNQVDNDLFRINAAVIMGYFPDGEDLSMIKKTEFNHRLKEKLMLTIKTNPPPSPLEIKLNLGEEEKEIDKLANYFCLNDVRTNTIRLTLIDYISNSRNHLSWKGMFSLFQNIAMLYRQTNNLDVDNILKTYKIIFNNESNIDIVNANKFIKIIREYLGYNDVLDNNEQEIPAAPATSLLADNWSWILDKWEKAFSSFKKTNQSINEKSKIVFKKCKNNSNEPIIIFKKNMD